MSGICHPLEVPSPIKEYNLKKLRVTNWKITKD